MLGKRKPKGKVKYRQTRFANVPSTKKAKLAHKQKIRALRNGEPVI